jgi:hypothetical protein
MPPCRQALQVAGGDQFADDHGDGLERLDLVLAIGAVRLVLDDENAQRAAGAQDRHAEEGVENLFARLRQVFEGGVLLRLGEVQRPGRRGDGADEALAEAQGGVVHRIGIKADGGIELEHAVGAQHIGRADLGDHVLGDLAHDPVEPVLRLHRLRHDFAETFQQYPWSGVRLAKQLALPARNGWCARKIRALGLKA